MHVSHGTFRQRLFLSGFYVNGSTFLERIFESHLVNKGSAKASPETKSGRVFDCFHFASMYICICYIHVRVCVVQLALLQPLCKYTQTFKTRQSKKMYGLLGKTLKKKNYFFTNDIFVLISKSTINNLMVNKIKTFSNKINGTNIRFYNLSNFCIFYFHLSIWVYGLTKF